MDSKSVNEMSLVELRELQATLSSIIGSKERQGDIERLRDSITPPEGYKLQVGMDINGVLCVEFWSEEGELVYPVNMASYDPGTHDVQSYIRTLFGASLFDYRWTMHVADIITLCDIVDGYGDEYIEYVKNEGEGGVSNEIIENTMTFINTVTKGFNDYNRAIYMAYVYGSEGVCGAFRDICAHRYINILIKTFLSDTGHKLFDDLIKEKFSMRNDKNWKCGPRLLLGEISLLAEAKLNLCNQTDRLKMTETILRVMRQVLLDEIIMG